MWSMLRKPSIDRNIPETSNDISQGFLTWPQIKELLAWSKTVSADRRELLENAVWNRQSHLTEAWQYEHMLQDYYELLKENKL